MYVYKFKVYCVLIKNNILLNIMLMKFEHIVAIIINVKFMDCGLKINKLEDEQLHVKVMFSVTLI